MTPTFELIKSIAERFVDSLGTFRNDFLRECQVPEGHIDQANAALSSGRITLLQLICYAIINSKYPKGSKAEVKLLLLEIFTNMGIGSYFELIRNA